jgi:hypothetical protein
LKREFFLTLNQQKEDTHVDLRVNAKITDEGMVGGVAAAVIVWPVALVGGALSYNEYEKDANTMIYNFWGFVNQLTDQEGSIPPGWHPSGQPPPPPPGYYAPPPPPPRDQPASTPPHEPSAPHDPSTQPKKPKQDKASKSTKKKARTTEIDTGAEPPEKLQPSDGTMSCKECGALLPMNWRACPYCGKPCQ